MTATPGPTSNSVPQANCGPRIDLFCDLHRCFKENGDKKYSMYCERIGNRHGVYVFLSESNTPLYVGQAFGQDLVKRIKQYYTAHNTGATFLKNWSERNGEKEIKKDEENNKEIRKRKNKEIRERNFAKFKRAMEDEKWKLVTISIPRQDDDERAKEQRHWTCVLEKALIGFIDPKYNKD